jgi:uncharacterized protein (TIGR03435 family)
MDVHNLVVSKNGPKMGLSKNADGQSPGEPPRLMAMPSSSGLILTLTDKAISMVRFADWLQSYTDRPVLDKTGLQGLFDLRLQFHLEAHSTDPGAGLQGLSLPLDPSGPSIFTAIQEQLGLKLESAKGPIEILVIDGVQKPSEN